MLENQNPFMTMENRRSVRGILLGCSAEVIENLIKQLQLARSASNPGHFVLYQIQRLKQIRIAAEEEELEL
jgi:hypothetical protein